MAQKEGQCHPPKRTAPATATDVGSAYGAEEEEDFQLEKDRKIERLRLEIRRLRIEGARGRPQSSSIAFPAVPTVEQRAAAGERVEESR